MGLFQRLLGPDINEGIRTFHDTKGACLMDVRTPQEYRQGHVPGSINIPLDSLSRVQKKVKNRNTPLYVYCLSGARSRQAVSQLGQMGYTNVTNIGGYQKYKGKAEM